MAAPVTVDESITSSTTSPPNNPVSPSTFVVSDTATVTNATALGPVANTVTQTLTLPGDCTTSTPPLTVVTPGVLVPAGPAGTASVTTNWTVTCTLSSFHTFSVTQSEAITNPAFTDSSSGNDTDTSASITGLTATSDPYIVSASASSSATSVKNIVSISTAGVVTTSNSHHFVNGEMITIAGSTTIPSCNGTYAITGVNSVVSAVKFTIACAPTTAQTVPGGTATGATECLPESPPAPGCASAPVVAIGSPQTVTVTKKLANLSGYNGESVQDTVVWVGALEAPGGAISENPVR